MHQQVIGPFEPRFKAQVLKLEGQTYRHRQAEGGSVLDGPGQGSAQPDPTLRGVPDAPLLAMAMALPLGPHRQGQGGGGFAPLGDGESAQPAV